MQHVDEQPCILASAFFHDGQRFGEIAAGAVGVEFDERVEAAGLRKIAEPAQLLPAVLGSVQAEEQQQIRHGEAADRDALQVGRLKLPPEPRQVEGE